MTDTNILVHSTVGSSPWHKETRNWLSILINDDVELCISTQVIREYLVILTRGDIFERKFTPKEALNALKTILPDFIIFNETEETLIHLYKLINRYGVKGKVIHDANIVATMLTHGITRLITYNTEDFRRFGEIKLETKLT